MVINDDGIRLSAVLEKPEDPECRRIVIVLHGFSSAKDRLHTIQAAEAKPGLQRCASTCTATEKAAGNSGNTRFSNGSATR